MHGEDFALEPFPRILGNTAHDFTSWAMAGTSDPIAVLTGSLARTELPGYESSEYRGASILEPFEGSGAKETIGLLGSRVILANSVDQVKAAIDAAVGEKPSLADDETTASLLHTIAPSNALMVIDAAKQAVACASGDESRFNPSGQFVAIANGRIGEGGEPRTLVATSFASEEEAASAEAAYELGWQDGYVLAGTSGAPIANFAKVNFVSQSGNLLIAELVDGREDGWTRAAIRFATPVCDAVSESISDSMVATPQIDELSDLNRALASLPDPGMEGATLAADLASAAQQSGTTAPEDLNIRAEDIEGWLAKIGPIPSFSAFPSDGTKLARWPETLGISLGSISAISETHGSDVEQTAAVLVGTWDPEIVEEHLSRLGFVRSNWEDATIFTFTGSLEDPSHRLNRAADATWSNVAILGDQIFVSPSSRRLREVLDIATGDTPAPAPPDGVYLRDRLVEKESDVTLFEIVGRDFMTDTCVEAGLTGVAPEWFGAVAFWSASATGGRGKVDFIPDPSRSLVDVRQDVEAQVLSEGAPEDAMAVPSANPFAEAFGYQGIQQGQLADGTTVLAATFSPPPGESTGRFFARTLEGCRFGGA
jgi:peptidoglycan hydrolase-like protein with peptidoglycan-binding domain